MLSDEREKLQI